MNFKHSLLLTFLFTAHSLWSQNQASVVGVVLSDTDEPISNVQVSAGNHITYTDESGFYQLSPLQHGNIQLKFQHQEYQSLVFTEYIYPDRVHEINVRMQSGTTVLDEIVIDRADERFIGNQKISATVIRKIPGANAGVENILKTLPGVNSNNELSTQYAVRGGSYDENLIYVNEVEVYRPFLIRSGQQEGLSFTNTSMVESVDFSSGGFQSKYGDKMSSVLDINYRRPSVFGFELDASLLGGGLTVDWASKDQKWSAMNGVRYRNNKLLLNTQDVEMDYSPRFIDFQSMISFQPNTKWDISFLGNATKNVYDFTPEVKVTNFGTVNEPKQMLVHYEGKEIDKYVSYFGSLKASFKPNTNNHYRFITSAYHTLESENYDILGSYSMGNVSTDLGGNAGEVEYTEGLGTQLNHGRNKYDAFIASAEVKATHRLSNHQNAKNTKEIEWGLRYVYEDIRDRLSEWEVVDSAGFHIAPPMHAIPNDEPYTPYQGDLVPFQKVKATNFVTINRLQVYLQWGQRKEVGNTQLYWNIGLRSQFWNVNENNQSHQQFTISPRAQIALKPDWKADMLFRLSGGLYHQPPSYRELRRMDGTINGKVKAQEAIHVVLSHDYSFRWKETPFKLTTDLYYKDINHVNTYTLENVRIRYRADNDAQAYVYGVDMRLNGEIVPGTESWLSFGYMKTEENYQNKGYISRPTDQRLKFGMMFQDYMPAIPNLKLYLNLVYNTGLPGGSPTYADPYNYVFRLPDYRRVDAGFIYVLKDHSLGHDKDWLTNWQELTVGFEIYNMFQNANSITNTWVRDVSTKIMYAIPNYMTMRTFNLKVNARW